MSSNTPPNGNPNGVSFNPNQGNGSEIPRVLSNIAGAITYPANSSDSARQSQTSDTVDLTPASYPSVSTQNINASRMSLRRPPRNLQGLLKFAMEATQAEDAPGNKEDVPVDTMEQAPGHDEVLSLITICGTQTSIFILAEERRQFLEEALRSLSVNVSEVLDNAIKVLTNVETMNNIQVGQPVPDEVKNSFTILLDYVDDLDVANDFYKMGGFAMFPICYGCQNEEVRARASSVLGTLCQNNPFCQTRALDCGLLHVLLNLVQTEKGNTLAKCLYAVSCLSREFEPACRELIAQGGCEILVNLLTCDEQAARTKAAFLIRYFSQHYSDARKLFVRNNIIKIIAGKIQTGRDESTEHLLSILHVLVSSKDATIIRLCKDIRYNLRKVLEDHLKQPDLMDDRFAEEKEYCTDILSIVFGVKVDRDEEEVDR